MQRNNLTVARAVQPVQEHVSEETARGLWDLVNGRTMGDDVPDGCDSFDYMLTIDTNYTP